MRRTFAILMVLLCAMTLTTGLLMWGEPDPASRGATLITASASETAP